MFIRSQGNLYAISTPFLTTHEVRKEVDLRESGVMPVAVRDSKQKYNPKI